ncbi:MAG TPA: tannase/feruloyl esterase family alpha/beta hydrolase [Actinospica sp.]|nr:tannase/feruloyl esterase family alpha/beta hydrolase [Actinospica sp.]
MQALGGSVYQAGNLTNSGFAVGLKDGYVTTTTDAGVTQNPIDASWGLKSDGTLNTALLTDFASRSEHDMTVGAEQVAVPFYGRPVTYSYWNGWRSRGRPASARFS